MFCPRCGTQNDDQAAQCVRCATPFGAQQAQLPPQQPGWGQPPPGPGQAPPGWGQPPQAWQPGYAAPPAVPNHLVWAILSTLFCCLPFGIVSIVYSSQVNSKLAVGDVPGAVESSRKARTWAIVSAGVGAGLFVLWMGLAILGAIFGAASGIE